MRFSVVAVLICLLVPGVVVAQSSDTAAERGRLANQRIQAEADRKAREERERQEEQARLEAEQASFAARQAEAAAQQERQQVAQATQNSEIAAADSNTSAGPPRSAEVSIVLDQLRTLGELKDAGYVTDEEFAKIKNRILDGQF